MLERIRTFFGRMRGFHSQRKVVVEQGLLWKCTKCHFIFLTKSAGDEHKCRDQKVN